MSDLTKKALGASLKKILLQKPLEKITITDLTNDCGVNRQTFYYHFHDIYDLRVKKRLEPNAVMIVGKMDFYLPSRLLKRKNILS